jgi:hypothetical protein
MPYWKCPIQTCPWRHTGNRTPDLDAVQAAVAVHLAAHAPADFLEQLVPMDEPASPQPAPDHPAALIRRAAIRLATAAQDVAAGPGTTKPLAFLRTVRGLRLLLHDLHVAAVGYALDRGCTWEQIGRELSLTPDDAEARYSNVSLPSSTSTGATRSVGAEP